jgi:hypothetical protein
MTANSADSMLSSPFFLSVIMFINNGNSKPERAGWQGQKPFILWSFSGFFGLLPRYWLATVFR